jgi:hypothetical protein
LLSTMSPNGPVKLKVRALAVKGVRERPAQKTHAHK